LVIMTTGTSGRACAASTSPAQPNPAELTPTPSSSAARIAGPAAAKGRTSTAGGEGDPEPGMDARSFQGVHDRVVEVRPDQPHLVPGVGEGVGERRAHHPGPQHGHPRHPPRVTATGSAARRRFGGDGPAPNRGAPGSAPERRAGAGAMTRSTPAS
jgi:hypothetical protein